jgi:hypothetical protein
MVYPTVLITASGIDSKTAASTAIYVTMNGTPRFYPLWIMFEISDQSGAITGIVSASVGTNSPNFNDILAITALTGLSTINTKILTPLTTTSLISIAPNTSISVKVTTVAIGIGATQSFKIMLCGFYD